MPNALNALTEKEKDTLRLIVRGHDAKSAAAELSLSVHTINERLRSARRKLEVTSSREAARILLESEADIEEVDPKNHVDKELGEVREADPAQTDPISSTGSPRSYWIGGFVMTLTIAAAFAVVFALSSAEPGPNPASNQSAGQSAGETGASAEDAAREAAAREWLALGDSGDWGASWEATASQFQAAVARSNYVDTMTPMRNALGPVATRKLATINIIEQGGTTYHVVRFETDFANAADKIERVALEREDGVYKVGGYFFER